ncbi:hypothetical protein ACFY9S_09670 [Streptomyces sp. NPDC012474]|uniref:hypothetical protein n=1 Tax=Streptomyces sp. NPDC012474 TaxID=3364836 RepID=UPI0036EEBD0B
MRADGEADPVFSLHLSDLDIEPLLDAVAEPGQTATGESPTTLKTPNLKINITEFDHTKSW